MQITEVIYNRLTMIITIIITAFIVAWICACIPISCSKCKVYEKMLKSDYHDSKRWRDQAFINRDNYCILLEKYQTSEENNKKLVEALKKTHATIKEYLKDKKKLLKRMRKCNYSQKK